MRSEFRIAEKQISPRMNTDDTDLQIKNGHIGLFGSVHISGDGGIFVQSSSRQENRFS
jgi:hypothetical protein